MTKISIKKLNKKTNTLDKIKDYLEKENNCYVLITCTHPTKEGKMQVDLNYSGDEFLAQYLIDGAKGHFEAGNNEIKDSI